MKIKFVIMCLMSCWAACLFAGGEPGIPKALKKDYVRIQLKDTSDARVTITQPFYIARNEVSNLEYRKFVEAMRLKGNTDILKVIEVDTSVWYYNKPYAEHYATHAAFDDYPVVGIPHAAAVLYCQWLTETYGAGVMAFRLPSRAEWLLAARGGDTSKIYSWGRKPEQASVLTTRKGQFHCVMNHWWSIENVHYNDSIKAYEMKGNPRSIFPSKTFFIFPAPKGHLTRNPFGLYHMNGNVAEMVQEKGIAVGGSFRNTGYDVRNESMKVFTKPADDVGFRPVMVAVR